MNLLRTLRSRRGLTLVELLVSMALLGLALTLFAATLSPAARSFQRLETLNDAQIVADDLLETIRSQLEDARGYVKCYDSGQNLAGKKGTDTGKGSAIEFVDPNGYVAVLSADDFVRHDGFITLNFFVLEAAANQAFNRKQGVLRVCHCLTFSRLTNQSFTILGIGNDRRRGAIAFGVLQHACSSAIHNRYTRVGSTQVDTNDLRHNSFLQIFFV